MIIALDTETTGTDFKHGARPFLVTTCSDDGDQVFWQWDVDPLDRSVDVPPGDAEEIEQLVEEADLIVMQNGKFDVQALATIGITKFPWHKLRDTLLAAHLLSSNEQKGLDALVEQYLGRSITHFEKATHEAVESARRWCRSHREEWMIAESGLPCMPSAKKTVWKYDLWLPKLVSAQGDAPPAASEPLDELDGNSPTWDNATEEYANEDSKVTVSLWPVMEREIRRRGLWDIYLEKMKLPQIAYKMEDYGMTVNAEEMAGQKVEYVAKSEELGAECVGIAKEYGYNLSLPKSGRSGSLDTFVFDVLGLPVLAETENGNPAFDADVKAEYEVTLEHGSPSQRFIAALNAKASRDTAVSYIGQYERFMMPDSGNSTWYRLYPKLNITGTDTLRWSSNNPNSQNLSKQGDFNLRKSFGPKPGRVWYSFDAANIELRIPTFECDETELVAVFNRMKDPPYFGSYHLVIFDTLHPELFRKHGAECKTLFEATWYQWVKNGNFARQYGAQEKLVDATYRVPGGYAKIAKRFPKIDALSRKYLALANKNGYVETMPDKVVDPKRGYPLVTQRGWGGRVKPTIPFCYHVSGTAMQWMNTAMVATDDLLTTWAKRDKFRAYMIAQVHDELLFDFPAERRPGEHAPRVAAIKKAMEACGERISVPTPVAAERHDVSWAVGVKL